MNHYFKDRERSERISKEAFWNTVYSKVFHNYSHQVIHPPTDLKNQFSGIDKDIYMKDGSFVPVEEKVRYLKSEKDKRYYGKDILLEFVSHSTEGKHDQNKYLGWIEKELRCTWIVYAFYDYQICYFIPVKELQIVWKDNKERWEQDGKHYKVAAPNDGYYSYSRPIPIPELISLIPTIKEISWKLIKRKV